VKSVGDDAVAPIDAVGSGPSTEEIADAIRRGHCPSDPYVDQFLPHELRRVSGQHWTPVAVAMRVAAWLTSAGATSVVDVGSGAGKFCVVAALASRCSFVGLEHRPRFVEAARVLAELFGVDDRVRFVHGALSAEAIPKASAYYLYNPFGENLYAPNEHLTHDVDLSPERYRRDVALVEELFERAAVGTHVIKYNGFGGRMPLSYEPVMVDRELPNLLRMWRKTRDE
jgi:hypothetical protein